MKLLQEKIYLILGIGTEVGKTYLTENLCKILPNSFAIKPIVTGFNDDDKNSDPARILKALGLKLSEENFNKISPWRFKKPISPHLACSQNNQINFLEVKNFCLQKIKDAKKQNQFLFIEASGGVMTPITYEKTFLDLAYELQIPTLLVSADYLGSITHTLCSVIALKSKKILVEKIILNEINDINDKISEIIFSIQNLSGINTILIKKFLREINE